MLHMWGYNTASEDAAASAASTAEPPLRKASTPAAEASACGHATMPCLAKLGAMAELICKP
jgi:hypothetical protein